MGPGTPGLQTDGPATSPEAVRAMEGPEIAALRDIWTFGTREIGGPFGVGPESGGLAIVTTGTDVLALNRIVGVGVDAPVDPHAVDAAVRRFTNAGVSRFFFQVPPLGQPAGLPGWLEARGFERYNNWVRHHATLDRIPSAVETGLEIRRVEVGQAGAFARIVCACFGWPSSMEPVLSGLVGRPGWVHFMAWEGDTPLATGTLFAADSVGWLTFAATLPEHRGRGAQKALVARRMAEAGEMGCRELVAETAEATPERDAPSLRNLVRLGFRMAYLRPNYLKRLGG